MPHPICFGLSKELKYFFPNTTYSQRDRNTSLNEPVGDVLLNAKDVLSYTWK